MPPTRVPDGTGTAPPPSTVGHAPGHPGVMAPPPLVYLGGLAAGFALEAVLPSPSLPAAVSWGVGGVLLIAGGTLARSFFRALTRAGTPVSPYRSSSALVTDGPYRLSRNPGYLAMAAAYCGIALLAGATWPLVTLVATVAVIDRGVIAREERYLEASFGSAYRDYRRRTRRWI